MPKFSQTSLERLDTCDKVLRLVMFEVVKQQDCIILDGRRGKAAQDQAVHDGRSKTPWPDSKHNVAIEDPTKSRTEWLEDTTGLSHAVDVAPYPLDWTDRERFCLFAGRVLGIAAVLGFNLRWGGDFSGNGLTKDEHFSDLVHFEMVG